LDFGHAITGGTMTLRKIGAAAALAVVAIAVPVAASAHSGGANGRITIITTEFVPANSLTGDVILIARGGPFGGQTPGHGTEYFTAILPTSDPNVFVFVGHDVYTTSFGTIRLKWRASCHPVNKTLTKYFCGDGTWHMTAGQGAYHGYHGGGTFTNISYSDSSLASFAHSNLKGQLRPQS
jgi:hypothetical protein